ncbi:uncharacterized protein LOC116192815 isoform X2 [Punica granatum]|uniref:50S ribosomal protein L35 n=2 Tax=Punica granatum TaxID=22663 RepID=A0A218W7L1_PUNGR|nr:uncharacterized protein LOC116192815 isoform X2 [Punica granatum]OWM68523.1 hypothetical protein CDL15_Pgr023488 [Punica granatum]PKI59607.1 hypothetical protein CRG98_020016 [Punica granatum]
MRRCFFTGLRSVGGLQSNQFLSASTPRRLLHAPPLIRRTLSSAPSRNPMSLSSFPPFAASPLFRYPTMAPPAVSLVQVRGVSSRDRRSKRTPTTPVVSKVKKTKTKFYSSYKQRFRVMNDGSIRRWKEGKRHNAHLKSKKSKRRLRKPAIVPPAYAKVMKKLGFCA